MKMKQEYLEFAKDIAYQSGKIMLKYFNQNNGASYKGDKTIVTLADTEINSYLIEKVKELNEHMNIPKSFKEAGIEEQEFLAKVDMLADRAFEDQCTTANPRLPLVSELKQILIDSYYGNAVFEK